jgi:ribosomal protein L11 methyltransferase
MMDCVRFLIKEGSSVEEAWEELQALGVHLLYSSEELTGNKEIFGTLPKKSELPSLKNISKMSEATLDVDWSRQWELHAADFQEGYVQFDLTPYGVKKILRMQPGPGFGDLSHPTTRLVISLMGPYVKGERVIDVGCGSGILSLAADAMGADSVVGVDIDYAAIEHARKNATLNEMLIAFDFPTDEAIDFEPKVVLMNMIRSEQKVALDSLKGLKAKTYIVSGVLKSERDDYLAQTKTLGWQLEKEKEEKGWLAFCFSA